MVKHFTTVRRLPCTVEFDLKGQRAIITLTQREAYVWHQRGYIQDGKLSVPGVRMDRIT